MRPPPLVSTDRLESSEPSVRGSEARGIRGYECDVCGRRFEGEPASSGLFIWSRGDERRYEEPPLCEECADRVTLGALYTFDFDDEDEG
ncbi:MAG TPA: hypothetical protein VFQ61_19770 [Polyangiaceae bacterium]|nr:hypothetical protein [Polyangiaceae bacterium]